MLPDGDWVSLGGWHPRYARVTFSVVMGDFALVLIDSNGDGREFGLDLHAHDPLRGWGVIERVDDSDDAGFAGSAGPFVYIWGRTEPGDEVEISYAGQTHSARVQREGWWAFLHPNAQPFGHEELPVRR